MTSAPRLALRADRCPMSAGPQGPAVLFVLVSPGETKTTPPHRGAAGADRILKPCPCPVTGSALVKHRSSFHEQAGSLLHNSATVTLWGRHPACPSVSYRPRERRHEVEHPPSPEENTSLGVPGLTMCHNDPPATRHFPHIVRPGSPGKRDPGHLSRLGRTPPACGQRGHTPPSLLL